MFQERKIIEGVGPYKEVRKDYFETKYPKHYNSVLNDTKKSLKTCTCPNCQGAVSQTFYISEDILTLNLMCLNGNCPGIITIKAPIDHIKVQTGAYGYDLDSITISKNNPTVNLG